MTSDSSNYLLALHFDLYKATASLMYLLQGKESVRNSELPPYNQWPPEIRSQVENFPKLPSVDARLMFCGPGFDLNDLLQREGDVEQMAFKGWVEEVYFLWDHRYRISMKDSLDAGDVIAPKADAPGDLRLIRNDLIHNAAAASEESTGRCKKLRWFSTGDRIVLSMRHVFDFLNQMGFMHRGSGYVPPGMSVGWSFVGVSAAELRRRPTPNLVSLRTEFLGETEDGELRIVTCAVFENGMFVHVPVLRRPADEKKRRLIDAFVETTRIDERGDIAFPDGQTLARDHLYRSACEALLGEGRAAPEGFAVPGPWFKIRE